ncbi:hypothetical protein IMG5_187640 [Ichthyophthirius multifiliis]|uniref:Transmembrane protein n=1 Tax=Ichthyophthirius multifiliis TaxID=5932 RepID=G0R3V2_ICHMU|nr:hypothetical protein IMG5_187640 [Ichthyophthirius multifiliis]EGR27859.1 hypothetical protein IMG5_187640 [Ichthyophthirius multifiliis]|eukprot:XP_004027204.1 hypothetical protein IMG5_187640 [Ichthyophthirius multifiliis]
MLRISFTCQIDQMKINIYLIQNQQELQMFYSFCTLTMNSIVQLLLLGTCVLLVLMCILAFQEQLLHFMDLNMQTQFFFFFNFKKQIIREVLMKLYQECQNKLEKKKTFHNLFKMQKTESNYFSDLDIEYIKVMTQEQKLQKKQRKKYLKLLEKNLLSKLLWNWKKQHFKMNIL